MNGPIIFASDYGPMVRDALRAFAILAAVASLLGAGTAAAAVHLSHRKGVWWLTPIFAVLWLSAICWYYGGVPTTWRQVIGQELR